ncbi:L,D-transpeptidase family protein [Neptunicoccus sediminis]|uniref:L,D-transpeptidase family protein n=1 Tax=Neptunicoccus sediminis TaxID=1892596 RepID=UPI000845CEDD|nr:L,D-transpeptidase family protein [Neptunicoccus sediminis]
MYFFRTGLFGVATAAAITLAGGLTGSSVLANTSKVDLSAAILADTSIAADARQFYLNRNYEPLWVGTENQSRASALIDALRNAPDQGLPAVKYRIAELEAALRKARDGDGSATELLATRIFLDYTQDLSSGVLEPIKVDREIAVKPPRRSELALLEAIAKSSPAGFFRALVPKHPEYTHLLNEKSRLERLIGQGGFGEPVPSVTMKPGTSSKHVVALRARLSRMGYGDLGTEPAYDETVINAVKAFQDDYGIKVDGVVGPGTLKVLNTPVKARLKQVLVNLERERWMNRERGRRHIVVNLANFSFNLYDNNRVSFSSNTVIGKISKDRTPEFHDEMTHMVVNPTWHVPRSITGKEYLPLLKKDPGFLARRNMVMVGSNGRAVNPYNVNFSRYNARNFPFNIKQRPSNNNALGLVKFMFPNKYNIYLHDTPSKSLFNRDVRAFSHGCVRVEKPFEFAYKLLERQTANPKGAFQSWLNTGREQYVNLETPVPVYLDYRTAFQGETGKMNYRNDIYGRDKTIFDALSKAGVALDPVQG